jgi:hypothetical protein
MLFYYKSTNTDVKEKSTAAANMRYNTLEELMQEKEMDAWKNR